MVVHSHSSMRQTQMYEHTFASLHADTRLHNHTLTIASVVIWQWVQWICFCLSIFVHLCTKRAMEIKRDAFLQNSCMKMLRQKQWTHPLPNDNEHSSDECNHLSVAFTTESLVQSLVSCIHNKVAMNAITCCLHSYPFVQSSLV